MPIRPDLLPFYRTAAYRAARRTVLERAAGACESCSAPDCVVVMRLPAWPYLGWWWEEGGKRGRDPSGFARAETLSAAWEQVNCARMEDGLDLIEPYQVRIVLAVCHLNHTPGDDRLENLAALCQRCHLLHDLAHHAKTRAARKDAERPIRWEGGMAV